MSNEIVKVSGHGNVGSNLREILYDPNVAQPNHAEFGQTLVGKASKGTLCTMSAKKEGYPYGSFVIYSMYNNNPIFLFSTLAEHTKNLIRNPKASLLISEDGDGNPLALGRITLVGDCVKLPKQEHESAKEKFLEKHPQSKSYADWNDFSFYQLEVSSIRYIGGFGKMSWVKIDEWVDAEPDPLEHDAIGIIEHMNDDTWAAKLYWPERLRLANKERTRRPGRSRPMLQGRCTVSPRRSRTFASCAARGRLPLLAVHG